MNAVALGGALFALALMSALLVLDSRRRRWRARFMEASEEALAHAEEIERLRNLPTVELSHRPRVELHHAVPVGMDYLDESPHATPTAEDFERGVLQMVGAELIEYLWRAGFMFVTAEPQGRGVRFNVRLQVYGAEVQAALSEAAARAGGPRRIEPTAPVDRHAPATSRDGRR